MTAADEIAVREATDTDVDTVVEFVVAMAAETEDLELDPATVRAAVRAVLADRGKGAYFLAETGAEAVGQALITAEWSDWNCADYWWLQSVYVRPEWRRRGVFAALYRDIEARARRAGAAALRLYVHRENTAARLAYQGLGMRESEYVVYERPLSDEEAP